MAQTNIYYKVLREILRGKGRKSKEGEETITTKNSGEEGFKHDDTSAVVSLPPASVGKTADKRDREIYRSLTLYSRHQNKNTQLITVEKVVKLHFCFKSISLY